MLIWQSALRWRGKNTTGPAIASNPQQVDIRNMIRQLRVDSIPETSFHMDWGEERGRLGLPKDFDRLLPRAQMALLADTGADAAVLG